MNRIVHNRAKFKEGFTLVKEDNKYIRLRVLNNPLIIQTDEGEKKIPHYSIIYDSI
jgi:hypothetical protein